MLRGLRDVRLAGDQARDHGAGDQAARDHDVARAALDDAARDDAALDHDLRAGRDAGHHLLGALHIVLNIMGSIVRAAPRDSNFCAPFTLCCEGGSAPEGVLRSRGSQQQLRDARATRDLRKSSAQI